MREPYYEHAGSAIDHGSIEREEKYCEVAARRLSQEVLFPMQTKVIAGEEIVSSPNSVMGFEFL